jgi:calcium channel MID1
MQLPKLTPLQSRLLASVIAICLLVVILIWFQPHHFVYAAELDALPRGEYTHDEIPHSVHDAPVLEIDDEVEGDGAGYEPEFGYFERSIIGRAPDGVDSLTNNVKFPLDIRPGNTANFVFGKEEVNGKKGDPGRGLPLPLDTRDEELALRAETSGSSSTDSRRNADEIEEDIEPVVRRQSGKEVYISINTCRQPTPNGTAATATPPQLTLYVSTSERNQKPGSGAQNDLATDPIELEGGFARFKIQSSSDVFVGVSAPSVDRNWNGNWHFEIAASIDQYYHGTNDGAFLFLVDTDSTSALFITPNLTNASASADDKKKWMDMSMPFTMYAFEKNNTAMKGLEKSACGLQERFREAQIKVDGGMIDRGGDGLPKAQLLVEDLKPSTTYYGYLAVKGNGTTDGLDVPGNAVVGGGGRVWQQFKWTTKSAENCQIIYDLTFCNAVAHAVPANPSLFDRTQLKNLYDNQAQSFYTNFANSLAQIACNTTGTAQYSLARNCTDCATSYKDWLCSVLMPRCEDYSATDPWLIPRNINSLFLNGTRIANTSASFLENASRRTFNKSRNDMIDEKIKPGPYKEILPCDTLCNDIVRSCPAKLQFLCPEGEGRERSYGRRSANVSEIRCSFPGAVKDLNVLQGLGGKVTGGLKLWSLILLGLVGWVLV